MRAAIFIAMMMLGFVGFAQAQDLSRTPLTACPGFAPGHPVVSQINWSVNCFLHALKIKNAAMAVALAPGARCFEKEHCIDGIIDEDARNGFFGGGASSSESFHSLIAPLPRVVVNYTAVEDGRLWVAFLVAPEKSIVKVGSGWMKDYFDCDFQFDKALQIWVVDGVCRIDVADVDEARTYDFSGADPNLAMMVWTPTNPNR